MYTPWHGLAMMTDPSMNDDLGAEKKEEVRQHLLAIGEGRLLPVLVAFELRDEDMFPRSSFSPELRCTKPAKFWRFVQLSARPGETLWSFCEIAAAVHSCPPSSAGIERMFSAYSLTHTKLRNRLSHPRVAKMVTIRRALSSVSFPDEEDDIALITDS